MFEMRLDILPGHLVILSVSGPVQHFPDSGEQHWAGGFVGIDQSLETPQRGSYQLSEHHVVGFLPARRAFPCTVHSAYRCTGDSWCSARKSGRQSVGMTEPSPLVVGSHVDDGLHGSMGCICRRVSLIALSASRTELVRSANSFSRSVRRRESSSLMDWVSLFHRATAPVDGCVPEIAAIRGAATLRELWLVCVSAVSPWDW
jgi:hypothetical protein